MFRRINRLLDDIHLVALDFNEASLRVIQHWERALDRALQAVTAPPPKPPSPIQTAYRLDVEAAGVFGAGALKHYACGWTIDWCGNEETVARFCPTITVRVVGFSLTWQPADVVVVTVGIGSDVYIASGIEAAVPLDAALHCLVGRVLRAGQTARVRLRIPPGSHAPSVALLVLAEERDSWSSASDKGAG